MISIIDDLVVAHDLADRRQVAARVHLLRGTVDGAASRPARRGWAGHALIRVGHWLEGTPRGTERAICPPQTATMGGR